MSNPCHIELILTEEEELVKKEKSLAERLPTGLGPRKMAVKLRQRRIEAARPEKKTSS